MVLSMIIVMDQYATYIGNVLVFLAHTNVCLRTVPRRMCAGPGRRYRGGSAYQGSRTADESNRPAQSGTPTPRNLGTANRTRPGYSMSNGILDDRQRKHSMARNLYDNTDSCNH